MEEIKAVCFDASEYEWLLKEGIAYDVERWTSDTVVIRHPTCGIFGFFRNRFDFTPPTENVVCTEVFGKAEYSLQ